MDNHAAPYPSGTASWNPAFRPHHHPLPAMTSLETSFNSEGAQATATTQIVTGPASNETDGPAAGTSDDWVGTEELDTWSAAPLVGHENVAATAEDPRMDSTVSDLPEAQSESPVNWPTTLHPLRSAEAANPPPFVDYEPIEAGVDNIGEDRGNLARDVAFQETAARSSFTEDLTLVSGEPALEVVGANDATTGSTRGNEVLESFQFMSEDSSSKEQESLSEELGVASVNSLNGDNLETSIDKQPVVQIEEQDVADEARYEYQGELTQADIALEEAPTAGLLDGAATESHPIPTQTPEEPNDLDGWGQTQDLLNAPGDPTFNDSREPHSSAWDSLGEGTDFDAVLGQTQSQSLSTETELPHKDGNVILRETESPEIPVKDNAIEDLWAAAIDDDELLDENTIDPSGFFDDDDDGGFLDDAATTSTSWQPDTIASQTNPDQSGSQAQHNPYMPSSGAASQSLHQSVDPRPASTPTTFLPGLSGPFSNINPTVSDQASRPPLRPSGSFVDKSKSGYASPYDLPTDIVAPRRRAAVPVATTSQAGPPPAPPRSSSIPAVGPSMPPPTGPIRLPSNPSPTLPGQQPIQAQKPPPISKSASSSASGFFADLPVAPKTKVQRPMYVPSASSPSLPPAPPVSRQLSSVPLQTPPVATGHTYGGLQQPERLPIYPEQPSTSFAAPSTPPSLPITSRYSPAPNAQAASNKISPVPPAPTSQSRYAAAPNAPTTAAQRAHAFIPKTSSPLAYHEDHDPTQPRGAAGQVGVIDQSQLMHNATGRSMTPPTGPPRTTSLQNSPRSISRYAPTGSSVSEAVSPPARPSTHSPVHVKRTQPAYQPSGDRRPSAGTVLTGQHSYSTVQSSQPQLSLPSKLNFSADLQYDIPRDERAADPLERWKGHPIFRWAPSGTIISSFPRQIPVYAAGHAIPVIKCTTGEIMIHDNKTTFPLDNANDVFPGPLQGKGKSKKKDVLNWMASKISILEKAAGDSLIDPDLPDKVKNRREENLILWRLVRILVEHDNNIDGKPDIVEAVRRLLVPNDIDAQSPISIQSDGRRQSSALEQPGSSVLSEIRKLLLEGQRERAVWFATENNLWSHAMVIASTMGPEIWKQLIHEFVKSQVQTSSDSTRSLAAVYEVFAGNWEESTDELVPPFARAGISVADTSGSMAAGNLSRVEGLEKWRETLALILSNRSTNDIQAIAALGRLLAGYGRVEAAHVCYVFAHSIVRHSGPDDKESSFVLLGADHNDSTTALGSDLDSILLTEIYEYLQSLSPIPGHTPIIPHLQAYRLVHAYELAGHGYRSQAQAYCESIFTAVKSSTRASPYYHMPFTNAVEDLSRCLAQAPQTASSAGLLSKLSSDKMSGSMWKRFNNFVAGDDDDGASTTSAPGDNADGPFGKISGNSPTISRAASNTDLYGAMSGAAASMNGASAYPSPLSPNSPYIPGHQPAVSTSLERTISGRYAPQPAGSLANSRPMTAPKPYEPQRSTTSYVPVTANTKPAVRNYSPYQPQSQEARQAGQGSYVPATKPEPPVRSASDYNVPYALNTEVPASFSAPPASLQPSIGSPYKSQPSPLSVEHSPPPQIDRRSSAPHATPPTDEGGESLPYQGQISVADNGSIPVDIGTNYAPHQASYGISDLNEETARSSYEPLEPNYAATYEAPVDSEASYAPPSANFDAAGVHNGDVETTTLDEAPSTYQPYEPSYQPYEPDYGDHEEAPEEVSASKQKKKSFMDLSDDEDTSGRGAASVRAAQKAEADRVADEAFRKAAEADAERDKAGKDGAGKKGWFGGWFGKKESDGPQAVRAKLGEENSFYFDKDLGKWVNKKGGQEETKATATPPPPKGGPTRVASSGGPPMSGPPSRIPSGTASPAMGPPSRPGTAGPAPPANGMATPPMPGGGPPSFGGVEPPTRPSTGLSNASSIDDLLGAPAAKKGTVKGKKRGGRYVDVMAK